MVALHKEPAGRYASVEYFSADIQHFLDGFPVLARGDSWSYRTGKLVRRHPFATVAAADQELGRGIEYLTEFYGPQHAFVADAQILRAEAPIDEGKLAEARALATQALATEQNTFPAGHPGIGLAKSALGRIELADQHPQVALAANRQMPAALRLAQAQAPSLVRSKSQEWHRERMVIAEEATWVSLAKTAKSRF